MRLIDLDAPTDVTRVAHFREAARRGTPPGGGLYFPVGLKPLPDLDAVLAQPFPASAVSVLAHLLDGEFDADEVEAMVRAAFDFPLPLTPLGDGRYALELFHGPTLAFKDFGARFMARVLARSLRPPAEGAPAARVTILTATSGDTGAAVAHAFHGIAGIEVVVLYPAGRISPLQERLFCTLGGNVRTFRVAGSFDDCQALVKGAFTDPELTTEFGLTSANSINVSRLVAQICYYFAAVAQLRASGDTRPPLICVPCGNFGNLTAGLLAERLGLPVGRWLAATNANDVVPVFLAGGQYQPRPSQATLANAMDVGAPNNWRRIMALFDDRPAAVRARLIGESVTDDDIHAEQVWLWQRHYLSDPHTAVAHAAVRRHHRGDEPAIVLATAHPAKFSETVQTTLGFAPELPPALAAVRDRPIRSLDLANDQTALVQALRT